MDNNQASVPESNAPKFPQIACSKHPGCKEFVQCRHCRKLMCKTSLKKHQEEVAEAEGGFAGFTNLNTCYRNLEDNLANLRKNVTKASQNVARLMETLPEGQLERLKKLQEEEDMFLRYVKAIYKKKIHTECPQAKTITTYDQIVRSKAQEIESIENHIKNNATKKSLSDVFERKFDQEFERSLGARLGESLDIMQDVVKNFQDAENIEEVVLNNPKAVDNMVKTLQENIE